jgi:hypothetical protein
MGQQVKSHWAQRTWAGALALTVALAAGVLTATAVPAFADDTAASSTTAVVETQTATVEDAASSATTTDTAATTTTAADTGATTTAAADTATTADDATATGTSTADDSTETVSDDTADATETDGTTAATTDDSDDDAAATDATDTDATADDTTATTDAEETTATTDTTDTSTSTTTSTATATTASSTTAVAMSTVATTSDTTSAAVIDDGYYSIRSKDDVTYAVDVIGWSTEEGTDAQVYQFHGGDNQIFKLMYLNNGYYRIINKNSGLTLGVSDASGGNGTLVTQAAWGKVSAQQWELVSAGNGYYYLVNRANGLYLDVQGGHAGNTVLVQTWSSTTNNSGKGQLWRFSPAAVQTVSDGVYVLESPSRSEMILDVVASGRTNGTNITTYRNNNDSNQKFKVTYVENGYYKLICYDSLKAVTVEGSAAANGTNIIQYDYEGMKSQLWEIRDAGDGSYYLISKLGDSNSFYLDVQGGTAGNGVNVWLWSKTTNNDGKGQRWMIERMVNDGWYYIKSFDDTNQVLDVVASSTEDGGNVTTYQFHGGTNQIWHITQWYGQYYKIVNANSYMALDLVAGGMTNGTNVTQWSQYSTDNQLWKITFDSDGNAMIQSKVSGLYLDVEGGHAGNTVNIQTWSETTNNDGRGQKFLFTWAHFRPGDTMNVIEYIVSDGHNDEDDRTYDPCYVVIHETANEGVSAWSHVLYWASDDTYAVHYVADWTGNTYHCMENDQIAWQVGNGNPYVIGIELCHATNQSDFNTVYEVGVEWAAWMLDCYGWDTSRLISHRIAAERWGGSDHTDPDSYFATYGKTWDDFVYDVSLRIGSYR